MKNFKRILSIVLAMTMVLAMGVTASAAPADETLKVNGVEGHTYTAYQLLVGDLAGDGKTLSNVKWGTDVAASITYKEKAPNATTFTVDKIIAPKAGDPVPQEVLDYMASLSSGTNLTAENGTAETAGQATADILAAWVKDDATAGQVIPPAGLTVKTGYYVIKDAYTNQDPNAEQTTTLSTVMCRVVGPTTVTPKAGKTEHKKEVLDINDTTDVKLDLTKLKDVDKDKWDDSADHDFGDHVPFKLTTKIGSDFAKYTNYKLYVMDILKDGLKLDKGSVEVYVGGVLATKGTEAGQYTLVEEDKKLEVKFNNLTANTNAGAGKEVVVYYTATLDKDTAVIGNPGNWNESWAEFSNDPNGDQDGMGKTPKDTAVVFTYQTIVDKVNKELDPLAGAEFTLTKSLQDGTTKDIAVIKFKKNADNTYTTTTTTADGTSTSTGDAVRFCFEGLDDGTYTLTETVTPNGFNTIDPVTFNVVATHKNSDPDGEIESLEIKNTDGSDFDGKLTFTTVAATGTISTSVVNQKGAELPSTGGMGTTIFYIVGAMLAIGAAVVLVTKKRMNG